MKHGRHLHQAKNSPGAVAANGKGKESNEKLCKKESPSETEETFGISTNNLGKLNQKIPTLPLT
jgi:hypothetical protein